jgi:ferric-dicitrate binding protein FerR (iron transport regulator)
MGPQPVAWPGEEKKEVHEEILKEGKIEALASVKLHFSGEADEREARRARGMEWLGHRKSLAAAAGVLLVVGVWGLWPSGEWVVITRLASANAEHGRRGAGQEEVVWVSSRKPLEIEARYGDQSVTLWEGSILEVEEGTRIRVEVASEGEGTMIHMEEGSIRTRVTKREEGSLRVRTPAGEIGVLGTEFAVSAYRFTMPQGGQRRATVVYLKRGAVAFGNAQGGTLLRDRGTGILIEGRAPFYNEDDLREKLTSSREALGWYLSNGQDPEVVVVGCLAVGRELVPMLREVAKEPGQMGELAGVVLEAWGSGT